MEKISELLNFTESRILKAVLIFAAFIILAKLADVVITKILKRLTRVTKSSIDDKVIDALHRPVFFSLLLIGAIEAVRFVKPPENVLFYSEGVLYSLIVFVVGIALVRISNIVIENALLKIVDITGLGKDVIPFIENMWKIIIVIAALIFILSIWRINITPLLASAGIAGVALALAAKDTLANFFGGISIFFDRPYKIGDYIILDGGERGEVVAIGIRSTRMNTRDDIMISIPNSIIANTKIINESAPEPKFRIRIPIGVSYGSDIGNVENALLDIAAGNPNILDDPAPRVRFRTFGDSSLNFELLCWAKEPAVRGLTIHELNSAVYTTFASKGIKIPFPQRDIHIYRENR